MNTAFDGPATLLKMGGDTAFTKKMILMFLQDLPQQMHALHQAVAANDAEALKMLAHKIRGGCSYCRAPRLAQLAESLELQLESTLEVNEAARTLEQAIQEETERVLHECEAYLQGLDDG